MCLNVELVRLVKALGKPYIPAEGRCRGRTCGFSPVG